MTEVTFEFVACLLLQEEMAVLEEKFGAKKKVGEEEEIKDIEAKTILHSK